MLELPSLRALVQELEAQRLAEREKAAENASAANSLRMSVELLSIDLDACSDNLKVERRTGRVEGAGVGLLVGLLFALLL